MKQQTKKEAIASFAEDLKEFFIDGIKDIYWAEKAMVKSLPVMIRNATAPSLAKALNGHLKETQGHVKRIEKVFSAIKEKAVAKKCDAMAGLIKEANGIVKDTDKGVMRDAGIIAACQKIEHYEIASYGTLAAYAKILGLTTAASLLHQTLKEEKAADDKLTRVTGEAVKA